MVFRSFARHGAWLVPHRGPAKGRFEGRANSRTARRSTSGFGNSCHRVADLEGLLCRRLEYGSDCCRHCLTGRAALLAPCATSTRPARTTARLTCAREGRRFHRNERCIRRPRDAGNRADPSNDVRTSVRMGWGASVWHPFRWQRPVFATCVTGVAKDCSSFRAECL